MRIGGPIYTHLKDDQKIGYWTVFSNIILVLVSYWLGLNVQDMISRRNANASSVLANAEFTKEVKPIVDSLNIKQGRLCLDLTSDLHYCNNTRNSDEKNKRIIDVINKKYKKNDLLFTYCSDVAYATNKVAPYLQHLEDPLQERAALLTFLEIMIRQYENHKNTVFVLLKTSIEDIIVNKKEVKDTPLSNIPGLHPSWNDIEKQLKNTIRSSEFIEQYGLLTLFDTKMSPQLNKFHQNLVDKIDKEFFKNLEKMMLNNQMLDSDSITKLYMESYDNALAVLYLALLQQAVTNHSIMSNNECFTQPKKSFMVKSPIKSLLLVIVVGIVLAWLVFLILPNNNAPKIANNMDFDKQKYDRLRAEFDSELEYSDKLIKTLIDHGIEVPQKDD